MKKPYSHRWVPKYFVRAVVFGVVFLAVLLVLNYLNQDKAGNVRHIVHSVTKAFSPIAFSVVLTYVFIQVATESTHYKEIAFALVVWCV